MIFIDTGAFLARHVAKDQHHAAARAGFALLEKRAEPCFTSNLVLGETFTLLARRAGYDFATERARNVYRSDVLTVLRPQVDEELEALGLFVKYADQEVSFVDCVSFVLMRRRHITRVFGFDRHFALASFVLFPPASVRPPAAGRRRR